MKIRIVGPALTAVFGCFARNPITFVEGIACIPPEDFGIAVNAVATTGLSVEIVEA